jgi:uncharacterized metal-binding protein YceD (DUF177 family)
MEALNEHSIVFTGLKDGTHTYRFELGDAFFALTSEEAFEGGRVVADVRVDKRGQLLVVEMDPRGTVATRCHRCDGPLDQPVEGTQRQIFHLDSEEDFDDEELVALPPGTTEVNLTHYFYECIRLSLPARTVHAEGQCDPDVEAALAKHLSEEASDPDPRWAVLQRLKNQKP